MNIDTAIQNLLHLKAIAVSIVTALPGNSLVEQALLHKIAILFHAALTGIVS